MNISTTEKRIFSLLASVAESNGITVRVAGGWVRDKVMGLESHDIDVCVDTTSGKAFAEMVLSHMKSLGMKVREVASVDANVEANKNLESAILPIFGQSVDFVQFRKETYTEESRNPQIQTLGVTPEEDAKRRDLTINALFYNLHTKKVEDHVGGLNDLTNKIARTPIDPLSTFLEDPLRILRAIRFACRFDLQVDQAILEAAKDKRVQDALERKVSRERVWTEMSKIFSGPNIELAMDLFEESGLRDLLLVLSEDQIKAAQKSSEGQKWLEGFEGWDKDQNNPRHTFNVWTHTKVALGWLEKNVPCKETNRKLVRTVSLLLHDVGKCDICSQQVTPEGWNTYHEHEQSSAFAANEILKGLKAPNEVRERAVRLIRMHMRLHVIPSNAKKGLRRILREVGVQDWPLLVEISKGDSMGKAKSELDPKYDEMNAYILGFMESLDGKSEVKPPLNGRKVMSILGLKPGPAVGKVNNALKEQLLEQPEMTEEEAVEFIKALEK